MIIISYTCIHNILALCAEHPKRDQNPKFTPVNKTTSIPVCFIWESPPPPGSPTPSLKSSIYPSYENENRKCQWSYNKTEIIFCANPGLNQALGNHGTSTTSNLQLTSIFNYVMHICIICFIVCFRWPWKALLGEWSMKFFVFIPSKRTKIIAAYLKGFLK